MKIKKIARFIQSDTMDRPYVVINCAMSADGKIASPKGKQMKISCTEDKKRVHKLRNSVDAILVGINTILSDNPKLTVNRNYIQNPHNPIRIVLDTNCRTLKNSKVVNKDAETIIIVGKECDKNFGNNVEIIKCKTNRRGLIDLKCMLKILYKRGIRKLMVEGGSKIIWSFIKEKLVDDMFVYVAPIIIGGRSTPTLASGEGIKNKAMHLKIVNVKRLGEGILIHYKILS